MQSNMPQSQKLYLVRPAGASRGGLYLVPKRSPQPETAPRSPLYRVVVVFAALFLAVTIL